MSNWINDFVRPRFQRILRTPKPEVPDNLWVKCPETGQMVYHKELEENQFVFPGSNVHMKMTATQRLESVFDERKYAKVAVAGVPLDPLKFRDEKRYTDRLKLAKEKTGLDDAMLIGDGTLDGRRVIVTVQDFRFMGGSLGMAAGEAVVTGMLHAVTHAAPFIMFAASGGARMQEGILSLMQMPRTTIAVQRLRDAKLPYIVVLTNPTTGGVTASYAMLGDVHIAEPGALIGFAGPRVIQQTIRENLPEGFQRAEYLFEHGMVDMVVHRHQLRATLSRLCSVMMDGTVHANLVVSQRLGIDLPKADLPRSDMPQSDMPMSDWPKPDLPKSNLESDLAKSDLSKAGMPKAGVPKSGMPKAGLPKSGMNGAHPHANGAADLRATDKRPAAGPGKDLIIEAEPVADGDRVDSGRFALGTAGAGTPGAGNAGVKQSDGTVAGKGGKAPGVPTKSGPRF